MVSNATMGNNDLITRVVYARNLCSEPQNISKFELSKLQIFPCSSIPKEALYCISKLLGVNCKQQIFLKIRLHFSGREKKSVKNILGSTIVVLFLIEMLFICSITQILTCSQAKSPIKILFNVYLREYQIRFIDTDLRKSLWLKCNLKVR